MHAGRVRASAQIGVAATHGDSPGARTVSVPRPAASTCRKRVGAEVLGDADGRPSIRRAVAETIATCSGRTPMVAAPCSAASSPSMKFIFGEPMKPATNRLSGLLVELERRADLLDVAGVQHHDLVGHGHGLDLVVGDVDHRRAEAAGAARVISSRMVHAQRGVEVGQRLVEQEGLGLAHDGAADGDALALAARELAAACGRDSR